MIYGFDTTDENAATGALLVYVIYRSRDKARFKTTPDMWSQIERFTKDAAKRSKTLAAFLESLKPRLCCGAIQPRWADVGEIASTPPMITVRNSDGSLREFIQPAPDVDQRHFMTGLIERGDALAVIRKLYQETTWIILLVRDRLEREKPMETMLDKLEISA